MPAAKLLHVLGAGPWQLPTIRRARELGHRVLVSDYLPGRPGYAMADLHEQVDITDAEATLALARRHHIAGIVCDSTDTGVRTAAYVADRLGLPGVGAVAAAVCTDKAALRATAAQAGLSNPPHAVLGATADPWPDIHRIGLPLVIKPVDNQSGRGVSIVRHESEVPEALGRAFSNSRQGRVQVEACVAGVEHIVDGFMLSGRAHILGIASKSAYADNPTIASRIDYLAGSAFERALDVFGPPVHALLSAAALKSGVFHAEFMLNGDQATPIDLAARGGGVMIYSHVLPAISGVDSVGVTIDLALGQPVHLQQGRRRAARVEFLRLPVGQLEAVQGAERARLVPGVLAVHLAIQPGERVGALGQKDDRPGFVVVAADDAADVERVVQDVRAVLAAKMVGEPVYRPFD